MGRSGVNGAVAQLGERQLCKLDVVGSIPIGSTRTCSLKTAYAQVGNRKVSVRRGSPVNHGAALDPGLLEEEFEGGRKRDDQATKGTRWMPRRQEAKKDVGSCEKRRGAANQALIRRCPNGETHGG